MTHVGYQIANKRVCSNNSDSTPPPPPSVGSSTMLNSKRLKGFLWHDSIEFTLSHCRITATTRPGVTFASHLLFLELEVVARLMKRKRETHTHTREEQASRLATCAKLRKNGSSSARNFPLRSTIIQFYFCGAHKAELLLK